MFSTNPEYTPVENREKVLEVLRLFKGPVGWTFWRGWGGGGHIYLRFISFLHISKRQWLIVITLSQPESDYSIQMKIKPKQNKTKQNKTKLPQPFNRSNNI